MSRFLSSLLLSLSALGASAQSPLFTWADADVHYPRNAAPDVALRTDTVITAWRGERIGLRGLTYGLGDEVVTSGAFTLRTKPLRAKARGAKARLEPRASWLRYVLTDEFSTCGYHPDTLQPYPVAEVIDLPGEALTGAQGNEVHPFWLSLDVPRNMPAGDYRIKVRLALPTRYVPDVKPLTLTLRVLDRALPEPHDYGFHLNLWQQPYSVSRYYGVKPWSDEHFDLLRPYMTELARLGQKVVSAILFYEPWGQQSNDKFEAMIATTRRADGTWAYDYTVFDRWVEFMASCGIDQQIDCYSMVPWDMTFRYWDEAKGDSVNLKTTTDSPEYRELWTAYLRSFAAHLRERGWFHKTCIAMDERGLDDMQRAYAIAQEAVPGIRMTLAGNYHAELALVLHDYSVAYGQQFADGEMETRRAQGRHSTYYTCCTDAHPGLFSNSAPVDATFIPLYGYAAGFDGWLHWSWLNWTDHPLEDSRFFLFAPGDTYFYYPGPRSSLRHERLLEGIQQVEKLRILRNDAASAAASVATVPDASVATVPDASASVAPASTAEIDALLDDIRNEPAQESARLADLLRRVKALTNR